MGVYNNNKDGTRSTIANTIQVVDAPMEQFVSRGEFNAVVPSDTSADNKLVNSDTVDTKLNDIWKVQGEFGAKNLLVYPYGLTENKKDKGVFFTINDDGSILAVGTATGGIALDIYSNSYQKKLKLPAGTYIGSGAITGVCGCKIMIRDSLNGWSVVLYKDMNNTQVFTITDEIAEKISSEEYVIWIRVEIQNGVTLNHTIFPMIRYASDPSTKWQEYAKSNLEITKFLGDTSTNIVCWGDSLTANIQGWTKELSIKSGLNVVNSGVGGEKPQCIMARQGGDAMVINNITIPDDTTPVLIASRATDEGISTVLGNKVTPLLQGDEAVVNPVKIGDVLGRLHWTGSSWSDMNGTWTFTRLYSGEEVVIDRPTVITTSYDRLYNSKNDIMVIYMGTNGGYDSNDELIAMHKKMIDHFKGKEYIVLGYSHGSTETRAEYEAAMTEAFGRRFISLRQYLAHPIYENGEIVSCYGLADQGLTPGTKTYEGVTYVALDEIAQGIVPHQILQDNVHYTLGTYKVIGNMLYKKMCELNIL